MSDTQAADTPEAWSAASRSYGDKVAPVMMEPFASEFVERLDAGPAHEALEIAAGTGALTGTYSARVKSLLATDFAPDMIETLRERMTAAGATNISYATMDGQALDLADDSFDRVGSSFGVMLFPNRARGFSEIRRVLRPGGRFMVSGWTGPDKFEAFALFLDALGRAFPEMPAPPKPAPVFSLADPATFKGELEAAGLASVDVEFVTRELELPGFTALWEMMTSGAPPVRALFERVGAHGAAKVREALMFVVAERFGDGPIRLSNTATVGTGVAP